MDRVALVVGYLTIGGIAVTAGWCLLVEGARWLRGPEPVRIEKTYATACICPKCQIEREDRQRQQRRGGVA